MISTEEARERALQSGALRFVAKPIQSKDVLDELLEYVKSYTAAGPRNVLRGGAGSRAAERDRGIHGGAEDVRSRWWTAAIRLVPCVSSCPIASCSTPPCAGLNPATLVDEIQNRATGFRHSRHCIRRGPRHAGRTRGIVDQEPGVHWVHSRERLLDQTTCCCIATWPSCPTRNSARWRMYQSNKLLAGKRVLIVDDDMRNIFALSSVLEQYDMNICPPTTAATPSGC